MFIRKFTVFALIVLNLTLLPATLVNAQFLPLPEDEYTDTFIGGEGESAVAKTEYLASRVINAARILVSAIAVLLGIIAAIQMLSAQGQEENYDKAKKNLLYALIGFAIVAVSADMAKIVDLSGGGLLGGNDQIINRTRIFDNNIRILITFLKYIIGSVAILMLVRSGLRMSMQGANEEEVSKDKKTIFYITFGLFLLVFVDSLIGNVFYKIDNPLANPEIDVAQGVKEIMGFTNILVTFVGPIAVLMLVVGGLMYVMNFGNEETQTKAKKLIYTSLGGIILIYGAFGLVTTFVMGKF